MITTKTMFSHHKMEIIGNDDDRWSADETEIPAGVTDTLPTLDDVRC